MIDFLALATAICSPFAPSRITYQEIPQVWDASVSRHVPTGWEADALHGQTHMQAPTIPELARKIHERLGSPSEHAAEASELEQAAADVALVLEREEWLRIERFHEADAWRYRIAVCGPVKRHAVWCYGETPAKAFRCAAMLLRGELRAVKFGGGYSAVSRDSSMVFVVLGLDDSPAIHLSQKTLQRIAEARLRYFGDSSPT